MLFLFALSMTPKTWLHDTLTGHSHRFSNSDIAKVDKSNGSFRCAWSDHSAESPADLIPVFEVRPLVPEHSIRLFIYESSACSTGLPYSSLRGPPMA